MTAITTERELSALLSITGRSKSRTAKGSIKVSVAAIKRVILEITGWAFIALGIVGLFLPFLQGILFILVGLAILSIEHHWPRKWIARVLQRFPSAERGLRKLLGKYSRYVPGLEISAVREQDAN